MSIQKIWASHRYSFWCRSADFEICLCVIIALQFAQSYLMSAIKPCTYSQYRGYLYQPQFGWPWFGHGVFTEKRQKKILKSRPWLTMVGQSTMVNHGWPWFGKAFLNHGQPWSTIGLWNGTSVNHGCPWLAKALSTMVEKHCQPWFG